MRQNHQKMTAEREKKKLTLKTAMNAAHKLNSKMRGLQPNCQS